MADKNLNISTIWHGKPKIQASGTLYFSTNTSNGTIHYWGTLTETLTQAAYGAGYGTGYADEIYIQVNGSTIASGIGKPKTQSTYSTGWPSSWNISFDDSFTYVNNATVAIYASCHKSSSSQAPDREGSCPEGDVGILLGSFNTSELPEYNPYKEPTFSITDWTRKARANSVSRNISYTISGGTGAIDWVAPEIYTLSRTWGNSKWNDVKGSIQSTRVYPPSNVEVGNGQEPR